MRADATVKVQSGETVVLAIVTVDKKESTLDYFPLSVEYIEKFYAGGIISESRFVKRERRPSDEAVLKARQVDHAIRSLFPKGFKKAVSVVITVMSYDGIHDPANMAVNAASAALMISSVPFDGPSAAVSIGIDAETDKFVVNPQNGDSENLKAHYIVALKGKDILNIEGWSDELSEDRIGELMDLAAEKVQPLMEFQKEFADKFGKEKMAFEEKAVSQEVIDIVENGYSDRISDGLYNKEDRSAEFEAIVAEIVEKNEGVVSKADAATAVEYIARKIMRKNILSDSKRTSGRKLDEIRPLDIQVNVLPRVHGSALFTRGLSQAMSIVTLGSTRLSQTLESFEGEEEKAFMHHYNGPSYSYGDAGRFSYYPGRREIGHGHITENAFKMMLPTQEAFPYTIRVVSEILSQNGSTSMAAACGTSLALMDAGVPIKKTVAGIAIGLVTEDDNTDKYVLLTDMEDVEDFYGDMDFKVVGTDKGINAIQLDNKLKGVPIKILKEAFERSKVARLFILDKMQAVIAAPREQVSEYAPKVDVLHIEQSRIGELIGPGGKMIKSIIEQSEELGKGSVDIDIQDDGTVFVTSVSSEAREKALSLINEIFEEAEIGKEYDATVDRIEAYGAFTKITSNLSGLVHVSEMSDKFVKDVNALVKLGDKVRVKVIGIDDQGRIKLTMKGLNPEIDEKIANLPDAGNSNNDRRNGNGGQDRERRFDRGERRGFRRN